MSTKLTREEELLLQDFSRNVTTKSSALFYGNALIVSAIPVWLFWRIHQLDPHDKVTAGVFVVITLICSYLVSLAYKNVKFLLKHKIAVSREEAVSREVLKKVADDKKMSKKGEGRARAVEEERGGRLRGDNLLHLLQQRSLPRACHRVQFLRASLDHSPRQLRTEHGRRSRSPRSLLH